MLLFPFKKLLFGEQLGLSLPVGEQGEAGQGGKAAPDVIPYGTRQAPSAVPQVPLFPWQWPPQDLVVPGMGWLLFRDERLVAGREGLEARDEVTPGKKGDLCSGMAVVGTQGWADMPQKVPRDGLRCPKR